MADPHYWAEVCEDLARDCKCPCEGGADVSPAVSYGAKEGSFALSCIDCHRSTSHRILLSLESAKSLAASWRKICAGGQP